MMKLKTIKSEQDDTQFTKYVFKSIDLVKKRCNISADTPMYLLSSSRGHDFFLCNGNIYIANMHQNAQVIRLKQI